MGAYPPGISIRTRKKVAYAKSFIENASTDIVAKIKKAETVRKSRLNQLSNDSISNPKPNVNTKFSNKDSEESKPTSNKTSADGNDILYSDRGGDIKKDTVSSDWMSKKISSPADFSAGQKNVVSNNSVPNSVPIVNTKFSDRDSEHLELAKDPVKNEARFREMFDKTAKEAGYDTPNL